MSALFPSAKWRSSAPPAGRLRRTGWLVLALGVLVAVVYYAMQPPTEEATPDLSMVREERARQRELGMMMGQSGVLLADIEAALERPVAGAALIAAGGALFSLYFFRAAWVIEAEERDARRDAGHD